MITPRRLVAVGALTTAGLLGFVASAAVVPGEQPAVPAAVERVERFYRTGPSEYDGDSGGIGTVDPIVLAVRGEGAVAAVVELSFQYRTKGPGRSSSASGSGSPAARGSPYGPGR